MEKVVTRIAPSPTGYLHFGLARTALFSYLYARQNKGTYIVRTEDTDKERNKPEYESDINEQLAWLGLSGDLAFRQSEALPRHKECLKQLIDSDKAYISKEMAKDGSGREVEVVRLRNPGETVKFTDLIRGEISFDTTELKDFVIARSIDDPLYHLAVVIDDNDEGVTHIIRGEDHISNTPRQILIQRALGFKQPAYAHLPLILMADKSKMSKRKHETAVKSFREQGILAPALINYIALLGWNPGTDKELFTLDELVSSFDIAKIQKHGAIFDMEKLRWFNREYLHAMRDDDFKVEVIRKLKEGIEGKGLPWDDDVAHLIIPLVKERISTWQDIQKFMDEGEYDFFFRTPEIDSAKIREKKSNSADALRHLGHVLERFTSLSEWNAENIKNTLWDYAGTEGRGAVLWPLRYSLTGKDRSPDPFIVSSILGKEETLRRVRDAIQRLSI